MAKSPTLSNRRSVRLPYFDYSQPAAYFLAICAYRRKSIFGEIILDEMVLNANGIIVRDCWLEISRHFANAQIGPHVVMPNHVHGIVILNESLRRPLSNTNAQKRHFGSLEAGSIPAIVRSFKSASTARIRRGFGAAEFKVWQRNYYEHVIRDADDFRKTSEYIRRNPARWALDQENPDAARGNLAW